VFIVRRVYVSNSAVFCRISDLVSEKTREELAAAGFIKPEALSRIAGNEKMIATVKTDKRYRPEMGL
jgi:hypothetical protein